MITLSKEESIIFDKYKNLKNNSGTHSPSIFTIKNTIKELKISIDGCFLSNPYATDLFMDNFKEDVVKTSKLRDFLEYYPSQNQEIAKLLSKRLEINPRNILIGNGAIEIIQALLHNFIDSNVVICTPTFSSYYEFIKPGTKALFFKLDKSDDFKFRPDSYVKFLKKNKAKNIVLINPNNPNGGYLKLDELDDLLERLTFLDNIIIDESFIHFAHEDKQKSLISNNDIFKKNKNVSLIKSMSKDFGVAGVRCGYGILRKEMVEKTLENGYLWNSNGISEYFFRLFCNDDFYDSYQKVRLKYLQEMSFFSSELKRIKQIKTYPSSANFILLELIDGSSSDIFCAKMLIKYGIYLRSCTDKLGLDGSFVRIASRKYQENIHMIRSINQIFNN